MSSCGGSFSENITYIEQSAITSLSTNPCTYRICPCSSNICRIRYDFSVRLNQYLFHLTWRRINLLHFQSFTLAGPPTATAIETVAAPITATESEYWI